MATRLARRPNFTIQCAPSRRSLVPAGRTTCRCVGVGLRRRDPARWRAATTTRRWRAPPAVTHGHPTGLAASDLTARAIADLRAGITPRYLPAHLRDYARTQRTEYHRDFLGPLWQQPGVASPEDFITRGWDECLAILGR